MVPPGFGGGAGTACRAGVRGAGPSAVAPHVGRLPGLGQLAGLARLAGRPAAAARGVLAGAEPTEGTVGVLGPGGGGPAVERGPGGGPGAGDAAQFRLARSGAHTSGLQSRENLVC